MVTFNILGIESSCDDSAAAVITSTREILSNVVISQNKQHQPFQGVVPEIAARSHIHNLPIAIDQALNEANLKLENIDVIASTSGPGLIGGVIVGSMFGKTLASVLKKPFIAVNHLEAHALSPRLSHDVPYPYLLLLVSGGHCQFVHVADLGKYKILGTTLDDALGEAFDKVAKMLNLPFPGGPAIEKRAQIGNHKRFQFSQPLLNRNTCDLSFSGLKTSVKLAIEKLGKLTDSDINDIAASFQYVVGKTMQDKMINAIKVYEARILQLNKTSIVKNVIIAGGVAANQYLRKVLQDLIASLGYNLIAPPIELCTDNAAMIALVGLERFENGLIDDIDFCPRSRWSLEEL